MGLREFWKNAFDLKETLEENEKKFLDSLAKKIIEKKLTQMVWLFTYTMQPIGFIVGQFSHYARAFLVPAILSHKEFDFFINLISKKKGWEYFSNKLLQEK